MKNHIKVTPYGNDGTHYDIIIPLGQWMFSPINCIEIPAADERRNMAIQSGLIKSIAEMEDRRLLIRESMAEIESLITKATHV